MISKLLEKPIYKTCKDTLKKTSLDDNGTTKEYMTESDLSVINFDKVKVRYVRDHNYTGSISSVDALLEIDDNNFAFIEFKNGKLDKKKQFELRQKVYDSIIIFNDIFDSDIEYLRKHAAFILVYNEVKNEDKDEEIPENEQVRENIHFQDFANHMASLCNKNRIRFELKYLKKYCFKNVYTFSRTEFEDFIVNL